MIQFNQQILSIGEACETCGGSGHTHRENGHLKPCVACDQVGFTRLFDLRCHFPPGSPEKIAMLAFRQRLGMPLWQAHDATFAAAADQQMEVLGDDSAC
ncbi:hypothetical protein [Planctopirus hydrillae]|uniref:Uncharacterized protein n=1 Tax=Planctopirus hydrillae TaxID=1841610 RepID=A0A1C3E4G1_9PLAN|nr:hypothetical protein [Planctopirus hydrillae]ODA28049.1 hypothetical protein A6X21_14405 [Planctopirus hydrillae]